MVKILEVSFPLEKMFTANVPRTYIIYVFDHFEENYLLNNSSFIITFLR